MQNIDIEAKLLEIYTYAEQIPQIKDKLDGAISAARNLNGTIRDLAAALTTRDDVQSRSITRLSSDNTELRELMEQLASDLDNIRDDVLQKIASLRNQIASLHDLMPDTE